MEVEVFFSFTPVDHLGHFLESFLDLEPPALVHA